jgi:hypothetical protein
MELLVGRLVSTIWLRVWVSEWVSEWVTKWVSEWVSGWGVSDLAIEWVNELECGRECVSGCVGGWMSRWVSECVGGRVGEWVSERVRTIEIIRYTVHMNRHHRSLQDRTGRFWKVGIKEHNLVEDHTTRAVLPVKWTTKASFSAPEIHRALLQLKHWLVVADFSKQFLDASPYALYIGDVHTLIYIQYAFNYQNIFEIV